MNAQKTPLMKILMFEIVKDFYQFDPTHKQILKPLLTWEQAVQRSEILYKQWVRTPMGFGCLHPFASAEELSPHVRLQLKSHFSGVLKRCTLKDPLPVPRSQATQYQWHLADGELRNKETWPRAHCKAVEEFTTERTTVLVTRPPCQPSTNVNASFGLSSCQS